MKRHLLAALVMGLGGTAGATELVCRAKVPRTACSTGNITVTLDVEAGTYSLNLDNFTCWMMGEIIEGSFITSKSRYPYINAAEYRLATRPGNQLLATMSIENFDARDPEKERMAVLDFVAVEQNNRMIPRRNLNLICH